MINMYVNREDALKSGKRIIEFNDTEFRMMVSGKNITDSDKEFMRKIDRVSEIVGMVIQTPFGTTDIYHLSTGCKTIININHILNQIGYTDYPIIDISGCGENVLNLIFELIDNTNIEVLLTHSFVDYKDDEAFTYNIINRGIAHDIYELITFIGEGRK